MYIPEINFIILLLTNEIKQTNKNKVESREMGLRFFPMKFGGWIS